LLSKTGDKLSPVVINYITYRDNVNSLLDKFFNIYLKSAELGYMAMVIGDRFKEVREKLGLNQSELARSIGANPSIISDIERGDKEPSKKIISALILKYKINSNWLLTEQGDMHIKDDLPQKSRLEQDLDETIAAHPKFSDIETRLSALETLLKQKKPTPKTTSDSDGPLYTADPAPLYAAESEVVYGREEEECENIPYVHNIAAGPPTEIDGDRSESVKVPSRLLKPGERYYAAMIRGGSMTGAGILDGDMALIRYADVPRDGAIQVVRYRDKVTLKLLREVEGKGWELRYMDGSGKAIICDTDGYETLGEFVTVLPKSTVPRGR
jgi:SOS-response transcriptional repressor LexA